MSACSEGVDEPCTSQESSPACVGTRLGAGGLAAPEPCTWSWPCVLSMQRTAVVRAGGVTVLQPCAPCFPFPWWPCLRVSVGRRRASVELRDQRRTRSEAGEASAAAEQYRILDASAQAV